MGAPWELWYPPPDSVEATRYLRADLMCKECRALPDGYTCCQIRQIPIDDDSPACMNFKPKEQR